jgi:glycosyltransferase involved in cell wall biosynthesis
MSTSEAPSVSVVLPTYNRASLLPRAIHSVLSGRYTDLELIVVNDASTDHTAALLNEIQDPRLRVVNHADRLGAAAARNSGIRLAQAEYVAFQDSDDEWLPAKLEKQLALLRTLSSKTGIVYSPFRWQRGDRSGVFPPALRMVLSRLPFASHRLAGDLRLALRRGNWITTQTAVVRRACLEAVGGFDASLARLQDWELWLRLAERWHFAFLPEVTVIVHATAGNISADCRALDQALERIIACHAAGDDWLAHELLAHCLFVQGDLAMNGSGLYVGRQKLWRAFRLRPLNPLYALAALASLAGQQIYQRISLAAGFAYQR